MSADLDERARAWSLLKMSVRVCRDDLLNELAGDLGIDPKEPQGRYFHEHPAFARFTLGESDIEGRFPLYGPLEFVAADLREHLSDIMLRIGMTLGADMILHQQGRTRPAPTPQVLADDERRRLELAMLVRNADDEAVKRGIGIGATRPDDASVTDATARDFLTAVYNAVVREIDAQGGATPMYRRLRRETELMKMGRLESDEQAVRWLEGAIEHCRRFYDEADRMLEQYSGARHELERMIVDRVADERERDRLIRRLAPANFMNFHPESVAAADADEETILRLVGEEAAPAIETRRQWRQFATRTRFQSPPARVARCASDRRPSRLEFRGEHIFTASGIQHARLQLGGLLAEMMVEYSHGANSPGDDCLIGRPRGAANDLAEPDYLTPGQQADRLSLPPRTTKTKALQTAQKVRKFAARQGLALRTKNDGKITLVHREDWPAVVKAYETQRKNPRGTKKAKAARTWECHECGGEKVSEAKPVKCPHCNKGPLTIKLTPDPRISRNDRETK